MQMHMLSLMSGVFRAVDYFSQLRVHMHLCTLRTPYTSRLNHGTGQMLSDLSTVVVRIRAGNLLLCTEIVPCPLIVVGAGISRTSSAPPFLNSALAGKNWHFQKILTIQRTARATSCMPHILSVPTHEICSEMFGACLCALFEQVYCHAVQW